MSIAKEAPPVASTEGAAPDQGLANRPPTRTELAEMDPLTRLAHENRSRLDKEAERVRKASE